MVKSEIDIVHHVKQKKNKNFGIIFTQKKNACLELKALPSHYRVRRVQILQHPFFSYNQNMNIFSLAH